MKTHLVIIYTFFVLIIIGLLVFHKVGNHKIVYVDSVKLLESYDGMKVAKATYLERTNQWKAQIDTLESELKALHQEIDTKKATMSKNELSLSEELLKVKASQLIDFKKAIAEKAQKEDGELTMQVLNEINEFLTSYGKSKGYDVIMGATNIGNIVYAKDGLDITDDVLELLNNKLL